MYVYYGMVISLRAWFVVKSKFEISCNWGKKYRLKLEYDVQFNFFN